jgi:hypothetical protein
MAETRPIYLNDFTGGLWWNEGSPPDLTYATDLLNMVIGRDGSLQKRAPHRQNFTTTGSGDLQCDNHLAGLAWNGTTSDLFYVRNDAGTYKLILTSSTTNLPAAPVHIIFRSSLSRANTFYSLYSGAQDPRRIDTAGTATALGVAFNDNLAAPAGGNMPRATRLTTHLAYMWVANTNESATAFVNRLRWSHPGRYEDWRSFDFIDVGDAKEGINDIYSYREQLIIVKERSVWILTGTDPSTFTLRPVWISDDWPSTGNTVVTCSAGSSEYGVFWAVDYRGVYRWDGTTYSQIDEAVRDAMKDQRIRITGMTCSSEALFMAVGGTGYLLNGGPTAPTYSSLCFEYDFQHQAWLKHTGCWSILIPIWPSGIPASAPPECAGIALWRLSSTSYVWGYYKAYQLFGTFNAALNMSDNQIDNTNTAYLATYKSPWVDAGMPAAKKRWRRPLIVMNKRPSASTTNPVNYTMNVYRNFDGVNLSKTASISASKATTGTGFDNKRGYGHATDGSDFDEALRIGSLGKAYAVQLELKSVAPPHEPWGIESITFKYIPKRLR